MAQCAVSQHLLYTSHVHWAKSCSMRRIEPDANADADADADTNYDTNTRLARHAMRLMVENKHTWRAERAQAPAGCAADALPRQWTRYAGIQRRGMTTPMPSTYTPHVNPKSSREFECLTQLSVTSGRC